MGFLQVGKDFWVNDTVIEKTSIYTKNSTISKFDFSCCKVSCGGEIGDSVQPSKQCCREFISLSTGTNRASNGQIVTEHGQKYKHHPIFVKNDHVFPDPLTVLPITPDRVVRKVSYFQQRLFSLWAIEWH
jgi:hypothetical protein